MALVTGTPQGNIVSQEELYFDGAPNVYIQDYTATPLFNPDSDGYYWGMSGTTTYPVSELACITDVSMEEGITINDVRCDTVGVKSTIQRRDYVDFIFTLQSGMPLSTFAKLSNYSAALVSSPTEKAGIGTINNTQYWHLYAPKVYNDDNGDYLLVNLHKGQFVNVGPWQMRYGENWIRQFTFRAFADTTKPSTQQFGVIIRSDDSAI
jgi:hypothetical protein